MDNRWQVKCGTALQTTPSNDPSSPQQPRNQMETASGQLLYPPAEFNLRSQVKGTMANNTFHGSGHAEPGNSFLGILSGPASLLQCDFQKLSNPKLLTTTSRTRIDSSGGSSAVCGIESLPPLKSSGLPSQNVSHQHLRNGTAVGPNSALQYGLQTPDPATRHMDFSNEKIKDASSTRGQWQRINTTNTAKLQDTNAQLQPKVSIEAQHSVSDNSSDFSNGCPLVFCSGICGDLLLSNTGLLGVLCSCHRFHMSISKFCEHSGLWNANPGDDVRMESGESIALWRKLYFQKFGIRVPEDQSGWNWPEGLSLADSLMKSSMSMPTSKSSDCMHLPGSFGGEVRSRQHLDNIVLPKDSFVEGFNNRPQRNVKNGDKFLGLAGNSQSYACGVEDRLVVECPISRHSIVPSDVGRGLENGPHSVSAYFDANAKNRSVSTANQNLQNLRALINSGKSSGGKNALIVDKDTSSSIELRLGQPNHQSQPSGNLALSGIGSQLRNTLFNSQKPSSEEQMIHYVISSVEERQSRQLLPLSGLSNPTSRMERDQSNHRQCTASNTYHAAKQEKLNGDQAGTSLTSLSEHFNAPPGRSWYSKVTNNALNVREHIISERLHCESHTAKSNPVKIHWNVGSGLEKEWTAPELGCFRPADNGKAVGCLTGNSSCVTGSGSKTQKWMENLILLPGMASGNSYSGFSVVHDNNHHHHHHLSSILSGAPSSGTFSNHLEKGTCFGNGLKDHTLVRSMGSQPRVSEKILTSQVVPLGVKASTSSSLPVLTPVLSQPGCIGGSTSSLDDNLRSIALRQILELSKQQHALLSLAENLEQRRCNDKLCCSLVEPSRYEEICQGPTHPCRQYVSEIPMKPIPSGPARKMDNNNFTPVTGFNNWCNLSTVTKGLPLQHKETEMHCQLSHDALQSEQHSLRLSRSETNTESFCQGTHTGQGNCSCTTHTKCLGGKLMLTEGNPPISFTEQMGGVSDKAPALIAPDNHFALKESTVSLDQFRKLGEQLRKNVSCHTYQWKDVPSKTKPVCDQMVCVKQSADTTDSREHDVGRPGDTTMKCPNIASSLAAVCTEDSFKEQEMSNISSGCSAPVVTQISVEVNNVDSPSAVAANIGYVNHRLVDEGSGIDKCWSSDDALESDRSVEFSCSACLTTMKKDASFRAINSQSSRSLLDEVKLMDSLTWKRGQNQMHTGISVHEKSNSSQDCEMGLKTGKRKREIKLKVLDASLEAVGPAECAKHIENDKTSKRPPFPADVETVSLAQETSPASGGHSSKPISKRVKCHSTSFLPKPCSRKREAPGEDDCRAEQINNGSSCRIAETADRKKFKGTGSSDDCGQLQIQEPTHSVNDCNTIARPVVCGNYGEMSDGRMTGDVPVKYKFVSLQKVLKTARRCTLPKTCKPGQTLLKELKLTKLSWSKTWYEKVSNLKRKNDNALGYEGVNLHDSMKGKGPSTCAYQGSANESLVLEKEKGKEIEKASSVLDSQTEGQPKAKFKELRSRNLNELSLTGKNSSSEMVSHKKILNCALKRRAKKLDNDSGSGSDDSFCISGSYKIITKRYTQKQKKSPTKDSFCCVCGTSSQDEINCLLECGRCLIRVHQACYGVSQVPKHTWYCRPCRTGSENIVCVLCGYGGGAMTRALRCRSIMKTFLKAWGLETDLSQKSANLSAETLQDELTMLRSSGSMVESTFCPSLHPVNVEPSTSANCNTVMPNQFDTSQSSLACVSNVKASNSITIGMLDTTVRQWVHMVCGLWTPETRCPNVDTMSAFDVSGVSCHRANTVCSMCDRLGGSCIHCRVVNCSIPFHPWCAHQKGLLQSEVEGVDNENVGFYGRCFLHATYPTNENTCDIVDVDTGCPGEEKESCARTEGYKGRKRDGFWHNLHGQSRGHGGCLVPQEQINAWIHINGQKSFVQGLSKPPMSDSEHDCRKEYTRYKQARGWKHLVVYKSGIHALGLYTSRFIFRSEMVVEYIGEIVGQRVADKREIEYQSGRKLQYKSACYFFRIEKEHIIDATQMGGIARFVNHSCQPNCVAKVITVRNEKKVVFFAVRDIYPGEEITYDYHFNHEDEGKKIPCFCNSKNCRRYLN